MTAATRSRPLSGRQITALLLPISLIYGILSAIRWPQAYTVSHLVIDYHFGFGKRGLLDAILELIDRAPYHYNTLACMAYVVFALNLSLLAILSWRLAKADTVIAVMLALFFLSAGFSSLVCDIGRGEHFGLLLCLVCLLPPPPLAWCPARTILLVVAVLMQEANFPIFAPLVAFDAWIGLRAHQWRAASYTLAAMLPTVLLTWYLGSVRTACNTPEATAYFQHMARDFEVQWRPVATLCNNGGANIRIVKTFLWSVDTNAILFPLALLVSLPSTLLNLVSAARVVSGRLIATVTCVIAVLAPLTLLVVAADVVRFVTLIQMTSLLALLSVARRLGVPACGVVPSSSFRLPILLAIAAFELGSSLPLNDGSPMLKFPFEPLVHRAIAVISRREPFVIIN